MISLELILNMILIENYDQSKSYVSIIVVYSYLYVQNQARFFADDVPESESLLHVVDNILICR